jgi:hypothetical protein
MRRPGGPSSVGPMEPTSRSGLPGKRRDTSVLANPGIMAAAYASFAVFAGLTVLLSTEPIHRLWGTWAVCGYGLAALITLAWKARGAMTALGLSVAGAVIGPLGQLAATGRNMPEVSVIERAAALLLQHGTPYLSAAQQAGGGYSRYNPYLPAMTVFGLPHALLRPGLLTDPRVWAGAAFIGLCAAAFQVSGLRGTGLRGAGPGLAMHRTAFLVATPLIAFPLAVSGNDLPVLGLLCLGLSYAGRPDPDARAGAPAGTGGAGTNGAGTWAGSPVAAGILLGLAAAMKATAWPALPVVCALLAARYGPRTAARFAVAAGAVFAAVLAPWAITAPAALLRNTVLFPLGLAGVRSPAASPLPGHLLAAAGHPGHVIAIAALAGGGLAVAGSLLLRPPATLAAACRALAIGLTLMFALAPASRWGYFVYPAGLLGWLWLSGHAVATWPAAWPRLRRRRAERALPRPATMVR